MSAVDPIDKLNAALAEAEARFADRFSGLPQYVELEPFEGCRLVWARISDRWGLHVEQARRGGGVDTKPLGSVSIEKRAAAAAALHFLWERLTDAVHRDSIVAEAMKDVELFLSARGREVPSGCAQCSSGSELRPNMQCARCKRIGREAHLR